MFHHCVWSMLDWARVSAGPPSLHWYWKRWRHVRTRIRELIALGVPRRQAIRHGITRKGPWHMAKTIASGVGMTNTWLAAQGVLSLKTLWAELAHLRRTAVCGPACTVVWGERREQPRPLPDRYASAAKSLGDPRKSMLCTCANLWRQSQWNVELALPKLLTTCHIRVA